MLEEATINGYGHEEAKVVQGRCVHDGVLTPETFTLGGGGGEGEPR